MSQEMHMQIETNKKTHGHTMTCKLTDDFASFLPVLSRFFGMSIKEHHSLANFALLQDTGVWYRELWEQNNLILE